MNDKDYIDMLKNRIFELENALVNSVRDNALLSHENTRLIAENNVLRETMNLLKGGEQ